MTATSPKRSFRQRMGALIVALHLGLLAAAVIYYFFKGFDMEELTALFAILAPVTALYGGIAFRSLGNGESKTSTVPPARAKTIRLLVWGHFLSIGILISLKALAPNLLNFKEMTILLGVVESYFGAHMGTLVHVVFGKE